jgi:hypothetical protein
MPARWLGKASHENAATGRPNLFGGSTIPPPTSWGVLNAFP